VHSSKLGIYVASRFKHYETVRKVARLRYPRECRFHSKTHRKTDVGVLVLLVWRSIIPSRRGREHCLEGSSRTRAFSFDAFVALSRNRVRTSSAKLYSPHRRLGYECARFYGSPLFKGANVMYDREGKFHT